MCLDEISNYPTFQSILKVQFSAKIGKSKKITIRVSRAFWDFFEHPLVKSKKLGIFEKLVSNNMCTLLKKRYLSQVR